MGLDFLAFLATIALELSDMVAPPSQRPPADADPVVIDAPSLEALREQLEAPKVPVIADSAPGPTPEPT